MELNRPDPRVRLSSALCAVLLSVVPAAVSLVLFRFTAKHSIALCFTALWAVLLVLTVAVYIPLRYRRMRYGATDTHIIQESGVLILRRQQMPLTCVRHITIIRGPIGRACGYCFVALSAAGGWMLLEGVPLAEAEEWMHRLAKK